MSTVGRSITRFGWTTRVPVAEWVGAPPLFPVTIKLVLPVGVVPDVVTVRVEFPAPVIEVGLKVPVDPAGKEAMFNGILPVNPLSAVTVTV